MSTAGTITWGGSWKLGLLGFPAGRTAGQTPQRPQQTPPAGQKRTSGGQDRPADRWQKKEQSGARTGERTLDRSGQQFLEKPVEAEWQGLVERWLKGGSFAWTELVKSHHRRVYGLCFRFTGSATDAEDLTQEVFLKVYGNLTSFDLARGSFQTWLTTLARNLLVDHFRRTKQQRVTDSMDAGWDESEELPMADRLMASGPTQHDRAAQKEIAKMVQQALTKISPELREAVILRDLQDMDYKEIAQVLRIPEG